MVETSPCLSELRLRCIHIPKQKVSRIQRIEGYELQTFEVTSSGQDGMTFDRIESVLFSATKYNAGLERIDNANANRHPVLHAEAVERHEIPI